MFHANRSNVLLLANMETRPLLFSNPATSCHLADVPSGSARQLCSHRGGSLAHRAPEQLQPDLPMTLLACPTMGPARPTSGKVVHLSQAWLGRGELSSWPPNRGSRGKRAGGLQEVGVWTDQEIGSLGGLAWQR